MLNEKLLTFKDGTLKVNEIDKNKISILAINNYEGTQKQGANILKEAMKEYNKICNQVVCLKELKICYKAGLRAENITKLKDHIKAFWKRETLFMKTKNY